MKRVLAAIMIAGLTVSTIATLSTASDKKATPVVETEQVVNQDVFVGLVKETTKGMMLDTEEGLIPLKGVDVKPFVDQVVFISGNVKTEKGENVIYVVKATVKG